MLEMWTLSKLFIYLLLFIFGNAVSSIFHFAIEDFYLDFPESTCLFGFEYGKCLATIFVLSIILLLYFYFEWKLSFKRNEKLSDLGKFASRSILGLSITALVYYSIKTIYMYLIAALSIFAFMKIIVTVVMIALFVVYLFMEEKHLIVRRPSLFFSIISGLIISCLIASLFVFNKFSNLESMRRISADCNTYKLVNKIGKTWNGMNINSQLDLVCRNEIEKDNITYDIVDKDTLAVKFNILSSENDIIHTRATVRLSNRYDRAFINDHFEYKTPGSYTKFFTLKNGKISNMLVKKNK